MVELKFKVWDKVKQKMFNLQAISFDIQGSKPFAISVPGRSWEPISKFELLQWTGFLDQHHNEVYEGDIVNISSASYNVVWNRHKGCFELQNKELDNTRSISDVINGQITGHKFLAE